MFEEQQRKPSGQVLRTSMPSPLAPQNAAFAPIFTPRFQRQVQIGQDLAAHTLRPMALQRQLISPVFQATQVQREVDEGLNVQRQALQAQVGQQPLPADTVQAALQRQAVRLAPASPLTQAPASPADWVQAAKLEIQRVADPSAPGQTRWLSGADRERHIGTLRSIGHGLAQGFKTDRDPAVQRYAEYGEQLATLQRQALTSGVVRTVMQQTLPAERPTLQRAVDEALQRQQEEEAKDASVLHLHGLQRQLAELDHQAELPIMERIQARRGGGAPLPRAVQRQLEAGLNHDLSGIRVHTDGEADLLSKKVNAVAFTTGQDIYFQSGKFDPNSRTGIELLAHEATHTVQQSKGQVGKGIDPDAGLEQEARTMGNKIAHVMPSTKSLMPPNPYAPGVYSRGAALGRVQRDAVAHVALKPLHNLQPQAVQRFGNPLSWVADKAKEGLASVLTAIPGYHELSLAFGKDLVTGKTMAANPNAILDALAGWVPGPLKDILKALKETNALPKAWAWFKAELGKLNLGGALSEVAQAIGKADLGKAKSAITTRIGGLKALIVGSARKIAEIGLMALSAGLGPVGQQVMAQLRQSGDLILQVFKNPAKFAGNLLNALKGGFSRFAANAPKHLQNGLGQWLTGASGINFPVKLDLQGVFMTALSVMGLTYQVLRGKLVRSLGSNGETQVRAAEGTLDTLKSLKGGLQKADELKTNQAPVASDVVSGLKTEVTKSIVTAGITKVASMLIPGGGFVQALLGAFRSVQFLIEQGRQIMGVVTSAVQSVGAIAAGNISAAVAGVEGTLARSIPVALGFLGKVLGLGNIGTRIKGIIERVRGRLDALLDRLVARVGKMIEKVRPAGKKGTTPTPTAEADKKKGHDERVEKGLKDIPRIEKSFAQQGRLPNREAAQKVARAMKGRHTIFKAVTPRFEKEQVVYDWVASSGSEPGSTGLMVLKLDLNTVRKELWPDRVSASGKKADGGRPDWSRPTRRTLYQQYPALHQPSAGSLTGKFKPPALLDGQDRRHIFAFDQMVTNRVSALHGQLFDPAAQLLKGWGVGSVKPTYDSIWKGLKTLLTLEFNKVENLFVGDKTVNQTIGREMEQAEQARDKAKQAAAATADPGMRAKAQQEVQNQLGVVGDKATDVPIGTPQGHALAARERNAIDDVSDSSIRRFAVLEGHASKIKELRDSTSPHPQTPLLEEALIEMDLLRRNISLLSLFSKSGNVTANAEIRSAIVEGTTKLRQLSDYVR